MQIKNITAGPKGIWTAEGELVMVEAGQTVDLDLAAGQEDLDEWFAFGAAEDAGLAGMKLADLKALAEAEGIDLGDATKKADIVSAIELAREAAA
jgi:hypothetical protein